MSGASGDLSRRCDAEQTKAGKDGAAEGRLRNEDMERRERVLKVYTEKLIGEAMMSLLVPEL